MNELWELIIYCENALVYTICGDEMPLRRELQGWKIFAGEDTRLGGYEHNSDGTDAREVSGLVRALNMDLLPATLEYRFNDVQGMMLQRVK